MLPSELKSQVGVAIRYIILFVFVAVFLVPVLWVWISAFKTRFELFENPFGLPSEITFANIADAWIVGNFSSYILNSFYISIPTVLIVLSLASLGGYAVARLKFPGREAIFAFFLLGLTIPFQAIMVVMYSIIDDLGLLSTYTGVILPLSALGLPFGVFFMRAFLREIPQDLIDVSMIAGCNQWQIFSRVVIPLAQPALSSLLIFQFINAWNNFMLPLLFIHEEELRPLTLGLMYFQGQYTMDYPKIFAGVTIITFPLIVVYLIFHRQFISGLTSGAIKN